MTFPVSHKTVFVLDHSSHFLASCQQHMEFDIFTKTRQPVVIPLAPVAKSLWTCALEAALEYCRIVWDIYPTGKMIRYIICDSSVHILNSWEQEEQNHTHLLAGLAQIGVPQENPNKPTNIVHGLTAAVEALCECTPIQHARRTLVSHTAPGDGRVLNRGRVIAITNIRSDAHAKNLEECFQEALLHHNKIASGSDSLMPIHHCDLVLIHTYPVTEESPITSITRRDISPILSSEVMAVKSGRLLAAKLAILVQQHYNLASTTVTGIPMKEEQNANSSANYDVELLHPAAAHYEVFKTGVANAEGAHATAIKEGQVYDTITLKWCTPRSSSVELHFCTGAYRITPVDVNSRPSSCLTNFLLNGRSVMLEMPRKSGNKVLSHMLCSHGGEIFIHTLGTGRSILEDPPSISEGVGGRVTDYRVNDFGEFMKENRLVPHKNISDPLPIEKAKQNLLRATLYWPMVMSNTTIFNMTSQLQPLLSLMTKEKLTADEALDCKQVIYQLMSMEAKGAALPIPSLGTRGKGPKKEEQYRQMWTELETFLKAHARTSEHISVLDCLLECKTKSTNESDSSPTTPPASLSPTTSLLAAKKERSNSRDDDELVGSDRSGITSPTSKRLRSSASSGRGDAPTSGAAKSTGPQSVLDIWNNTLRAEHKKHHVELAGRAKGGTFQLYSWLNTDNNNSNSSSNLKEEEKS